MSDNINISEGSGKTVRADIVGGALYQVIKVAFGADGVATFVSASDGFPVEIVAGTVTFAGEDHIGAVGLHHVVVKPTVAITTAIYAAGDTLAGEIVLTNAMRTSGGSGKLLDILLTDADAEGPDLVLLLFDSDPATTAAANAAFAWGSGDLARLIAVVSIPTASWVAVGGEKVVHIPDLNIGVKAVGSANLYAHLVLATGTPTFAATTDISLAMKFQQD